MKHELCMNPLVPRIPEDTCVRLVRQDRKNESLAKYIKQKETRQTCNSRYMTANWDA